MSRLALAQYFVFVLFAVSFVKLLSYVLLMEYRERVKGNLRNVLTMIGQVFNNCKIESKIATATTGVVYKATDIHLEVMRAIKIIHPQLAKKKVVRDRLLLAVQAWAKLDIPSFVQIFSAVYHEEYLAKKL